MALDLALARTGDGAVCVDGREAPVDGPAACALFHLGTRGENVGAAPGGRLTDAGPPTALTLGTHPVRIDVRFAACVRDSHCAP